MRDDVTAMTPSERGREFGRAIGALRRLERRKRDGLLTADESLQLREVRLTLKSLDGLERAVRGTNLTLAQIRAERSALKARTKQLLTKAKRDGLSPDEAVEQRRARVRLAALTVALSHGTPRDAEPRTPRAQPKRVSSVVSGGIPGLGRH